MSLKSYPSVVTRLPALPAESIAVRAATTAGPIGSVTLSGSQLLGRGTSGDVTAITLGAGLTMTVNTMSSSGGTGSTDIVTIWAFNG